MAGAAHEQWSSRFGFLMAAVGFAVGLGNIWRFPYVTGENGGAAFVMVYLACAFAIGVPILMAEILIGRRGRMSPPGSMREVALAEGKSRHWQWAGGLNLSAAFMIEVVYCVVAGWVLLYLFKALVTGFAGVDASTAELQFSNALSDVPGLMLWTVLGLAITGTIVSAGVQKGIERTVRVLMPTLFGLLVCLAIYNVFAGGFEAAVDYLFTADFSKINGAMILAAIGQAFFSIGVAMAGMMTFGAYLPKDISISQSVLIIIVADTLVALVAGLVIFPAVFNYGLDPAGGAGLIFQTLPVAFAQMPGGHIVSVTFFLLLSVAAITSMVGLIEPVVSWLEERRGFARPASTVMVVGAIAVTSVVGVLSYNVWAGVTVFGFDLNTALDFVPNQIMLPLGGLLIALFVGWFVSKASAQQELAMGNEALFEVWYFLIRYLVPVAVFVILVMGVMG
ncbi:MAG: sodium-dependent transporter [Gammaproteobacteria bacterium]|nr:sodium-dependent transporter [Gammaproteobacteria bacterium]